MSIEYELLARAQSYMLAKKIERLVEHEVLKGCLPLIAPCPVALEPPYQPIQNPKDLFAKCDPVFFIPEIPPRPDELVRLQVWLGKDQELDWPRSELFLKLLQTLGHHVGLEIIGNNQALAIGYLCHRADASLLAGALRGEFEKCEVTRQNQNLLPSPDDASWRDLAFLDPYPTAPYTDLLSRPGELHVSPYEPLLTSISRVASPALAFYQALFQPVAPDHNWYNNIQIVIDYLYNIKLSRGYGPWTRYLQQAPSNELHQQSYESTSKANDFKSIFALTMRIGIIGAGTTRDAQLKELSAFVNLFQHGGRPLIPLSDAAYRPHLSEHQISELFLLGLTYRPGFIVNSLELTGPVHIPPAAIFTGRKLPLEINDILSRQCPSFPEGTFIGYTVKAGEEIPVHIPEEIRGCHTHLLGGTGMGKSTDMEWMIPGILARGEGIALIDPHGDLVERLLCFMPESALERIIYFSFKDPDWIPIWNPLQRIPGQDVGRTADDLVGCIRSVVTGWGDRMEHLLRHAIFALLQMPRATLFDINRLLARQPEERRRYKNEILKVIENEAARQFWLHEFESYRPDEFGPPSHKLSKWLVGGNVSLMLSQPDSFFNFRDMMDRGMIFLADLSTLGSEVRNLLGGFMLSQFHLAALSRSDVPIDQRKQYFIFCDEAYHFITEKLSDLLAESRKFKVSLTLAHQNMSQFSVCQADAISGVGTTIVFHVDEKDARHFVKTFQGHVTVDDLEGLGRFEAIARIGTDIFRIKIPKPREIPARHFRDRIIAQSHERYYKPFTDVRKLVGQNIAPWESPHATSISPPPTPTAAAEEALTYDEF